MEPRVPAIGKLLSGTGTPDLSVYLKETVATQDTASPVPAIAQRLSETTTSDSSVCLGESGAPSDTATPLGLSSSTHTLQLEDPATILIQEKSPSEALCHETGTKREDVLLGEIVQVVDENSSCLSEGITPVDSGILDEIVQFCDELDKPKLSNPEKFHPSECRSDPFDDSAVLNSVIKNDSDERTITFRSVLIGLITSAFGACIAEVFMFKPVKVQVDILFLQILGLCIGHMFASIPGPRWWNPGSLAMKELAFSLIMAASASAGVHGVEVIATQDVFFAKKMSMAVSIITLLSSQFIGYGVAGILRPILVYPSKVVFPGILPVVALFHSMSNRSKKTNNQISFFKKTFAAISLYEVLPTYLAPALSAISIWCLALPKVPAITNLFGGALAGEGMGLMAFSADWTLVGSRAPLYVPLMAQMTDWISYFSAIIIYSWAYTANCFDGAKLPFISYNLLDQNGNKYNITAVVLKNGARNDTAVEQFGLPTMSTTFVLAKAFFCMSATASITIGVVSSVISLLEERKQTKLHGRVSKPCPHREITKQLRDFPTYGFIAIFLGATTLAILSSHFAHSGLSILALVVSIVACAILSLASGYFNGTLGIELHTSHAVQAIGGLIFPGNAIGNMWFTMFGASSVKQCVVMLRDLKLGTYMHLAPFAVVIAQLIGTVFGGLAHVLVMISIVKSQRDVLLMPNGNGIFTGMNLSMMTSAATSWGLFSHELFYPGKIYAIVLYLLIVGFFVPLPFLIFRWFHPRSVISKFNVSFFIANLADAQVGANSGRFAAVFVGIMSQFYLRKYRFRWYQTYNYILCAALDGGTQITVVVMAFLFQGGAGFELKMPNYFLNPRGPHDYCKMPSKAH